MKAGDNIYKPIVTHASAPVDFEQLNNPNHWGNYEPSLAHREEDISGRNVLIADKFYYFGRKALVIPDQFRPHVPRGQSAHGCKTEQEMAKRFIDFVDGVKGPGRHGLPHNWKDSKSGKC